MAQERGEGGMETSHCVFCTEEYGREDEICTAGNDCGIVRSMQVGSCVQFYFFFPRELEVKNRKGEKVSVR